MHSKDLENFLNLFRSTEEQHNIHYENVGKCNNEQQNILHDFENETSYQERGKLGTQLTKLRYERRISKDTVELTKDIVQFCKDNKAFISKLERLLGDLRKRENELENRVYRRRQIMNFAMFVVGVMTGMMIFGIYIMWMEEKK